MRTGTTAATLATDEEELLASRSASEQRLDVAAEGERAGEPDGAEHGEAQRLADPGHDRDDVGDDPEADEGVERRSGAG